MTYLEEAVDVLGCGCVRRGVRRGEGTEGERGRTVVAEELVVELE